MKMRERERKRERGKEGGREGEEGKRERGRERVMIIKDDTRLSMRTRGVYGNICSSSVPMGTLLTHP